MANGSDTTAEPEHAFLRACRGLPVERRPVWIMRQAGRYLPEYRELRKEVSFLELCHRPDLACEVTLQPLRRFDLDAAILFSDIMIPVEAMGVEVDFRPGPVIEEPVRSPADVARLAVPDPEAEMPFVMEAVRKIRQGLGDRVPLIGFAGAPFTLACYLVEGHGSKTFVKTRSLMYSDPGTFHALMDKLSATVADYLSAQIAAGAQAVQVFDSWVGLVGPGEYRELVVPHLQAMFERIELRGVPLIYFAFGGGHLLEDVARLRPTVAGIDWRTPLRDARRALGPGIAVQGNLDPAALFAAPEEAARRARTVCDAAGPEPGHVFNLGHGIQPDTPIESVAAVVEAVHSHGVS